LAGREHRLKETREVSAAPLPGKALVIFDPALGIIQDLEPAEDAYTQERALLPQLRERVSAGEWWIADRNFCTRAWLWGLHQQGAVGLVREHPQIPIKPLEPLREVARRGGAAWAEQRVLIEAPDGEGTLELRRIRVSLDQPTREGETQLYVLTTVPAEVADAPTLAKLYRTRWKLERAFLHLTRELRCEITTLAYPPAALFAFAMAIVAYNALAVVKIALRRVHGDAASDESLSGYYLINEIARVGESLDTLVTTEEWAVFRHLSPAEMAQWLSAAAARVQLRKYRKHPRGPKKPPVSRTHDPHRSHLSVARMLAKRNRN
jgi:Transposase DDE domain